MKRIRLNTQIMNISDQMTPTAMIQLTQLVLGVNVVIRHKDVNAIEGVRLVGDYFLIGQVAEIDDNGRLIATCNAPLSEDEYDSKMEVMTRKDGDKIAEILGVRHVIVESPTLGDPMLAEAMII